MARIVGVRFRTAGKVYYFSPGAFEVKKGDHLIVETTRGIEYGTAVCAPTDLLDEQVPKPVKEILRIANETDEHQEEENREKEKRAFQIGLQKIAAHKLEMKLIDVPSIIIRSYFILRQTEELTSESWSRIWPASSAPESNYDRSESGMKPRSWEASGFAVGSCAAGPISRTLSRYPFGWPRNKIYL